MLGAIQFGFFPFGVINNVAFSGTAWFDQCKSNPNWTDQGVEDIESVRCNNAT